MLQCTEDVNDVWSKGTISAEIWRVVIHNTVFEYLYCSSNWAHLDSVLRCEIIILKMCFIILRRHTIYGIEQIFNVLYSFVNTTDLYLWFSPRHSTYLHVAICARVIFQLSRDTKLYVEHWNIWDFTSLMVYWHSVFHNWSLG